MVSHVVHDVSYGDLLVGLDPEREMVDLGHVAVDIGKVAVHDGCVVVVAVEAPDTGLAVADGSEVHGAVGFAEAEVGILSVEITHFTSEGDHVG